MFASRRYSPQIARLVERQLGHITRRQLLDAGRHPSWIERHIRIGDLIVVHAGVYAVGHVPRHAQARSMAAVLACGPGAALSHDSAVALWGLNAWPATLEVTAPGQRRRPGLRTHRSASVTGRGETRVQLGVRVTSPIRTILDVAPGQADDPLTRLVNRARVAELLGSTALAELSSRSARIAALIGDPDQRPTRSGLEDLFKRFTRRHRLPMPWINAVIPELGGREVDAYYPDHRLIVELDGYRFHSDRLSFENDREKDARALLQHHATVRMTWNQLTRRGAAKAEQIRVILADRAPGRGGGAQL